MALTHRTARPYLKLKDECVYDVPLKLSLQQLLSDRTVFEEVILSGNKTCIIIFSQVMQGHSCFIMMSLKSAIP